MGEVDGGAGVDEGGKGVDDVEREVDVEVLERAEVVLVVLEVESEELWRDLRRKGREGERKVGKKEADEGCGSEGRRK
jgi:hypothetical protein